MSDNEDRRHSATERRRQQARAEGQAPLSRELVTLSGLAAATLLTSMAAPGAVRALAIKLEPLLQMQAAPSAALRQAAASFLGLTIPFLGIVLAASAGVVLLQTGFLVHAGALLPDVSRLDPRRGLKRVFGPENAIEALKSVVKLGLLGWALYRALASIWTGLAASMVWTVPMLVDHIARSVVHLFLLVLGMQAGVALLDVAWVRFRFAKRLRMSTEEVKQEQREADGDPKLKSKIKQIRQARARRRMIAAVSKATVVITNPTHYAVALAYQRGTQAAPRIVAKGMDEVAARIREAAQKNNVPLVANPPLARALHEVALDSEVPAEHFKAVAEIIAYVWRLRAGAA